MKALIELAVRLGEGVPYVLKCVTHEMKSGAAKAQEWRWWLGRLNILSRLLSEFKHEFTPKATHLVSTCRQTPISPELALKQLTTVKEFAEEASNARHKR